MNFDFWQSWGVDLDDLSFANAWVALGLARDRERDCSVTDLNTTSWAGPTIGWIFPTKEIRVLGSPEQWAQAWIDAANRIETTPARLRVSNAPPDEPILPWYRMLSEASPTLGSV